MRTTSSLFRKGTLRTFQQNKIEKTFALFKIVLYFCTNGLVKAKFYSLINFSID